MKLEITSCVSTQKHGESVEFDVLDANGQLHTLRISTATFSQMVIDAMLNRALSKEALGIELSGAATYVTSGPKR